MSSSGLYKVSRLIDCTPSIILLLKEIPILHCNEMGFFLWVSLLYVFYVFSLSEWAFEGTEIRIFSFVGNNFACHQKKSPNYVMFMDFSFSLYITNKIDSNLGHDISRCPCYSCELIYLLVGLRLVAWFWGISRKVCYLFNIFCQVNKEHVCQLTRQDIWWVVGVGVSEWEVKHVLYDKHFIVLFLFLLPFCSEG